MRHRILPARGTLLVNTDLHGNFEDFAALERVFRAHDDDTHWVILGDVVHAPADVVDGSAAIVRRILELQRELPERIHFVLGNHDHGHVGGPHTHKFHDDEVEALESKLSEEERSLLRELFAPALLAVAAPCGVLLTHGSPDAQLESLAMLDDADLDMKTISPVHARAMRGLLTAYGQQAATTNAMLAKVSAASGLDLKVVVHGHDRAEDGLFYEGGNQVCPVIFGAFQEHKRYVVLDLAARYETAEALRDGFEVQRLYAMTPA